MSSLPNYTKSQLKKPEMIIKRLNTCLSNITKGISWLAQQRPQIQEYLLPRNIYLMDEAPWEALSIREVTLEPECSTTQQKEQTEETDQLEYRVSEEKDLQAARVEAEQ